MREMGRGGLMRTVFILTVLAFVIGAEGGTAPAAEELRARQKDMKTVRASFTQEKRSPLLKKPLKTKGVFYFKAPLNVRWQYEKTVTVVYDGTELYIYYPELGEAERMKGISEFYTGPLGFDIANLEKDYDMEAKRENGAIRLKITPKRRLPFAGMEMLFPEGAAFPSEMKIIDRTGDETFIKFLDVTVNTGLSDELFKFVPPPGVRIKERTAP